MEVNIKDSRNPDLEVALARLKAEKIQSTKRENGDLIVLKGQEYLVGYDVWWLENYDNGKPCKQWVSGYWDSDSPTFYGSECIFLPTQAQLQKMIYPKYRKDCSTPYRAMIVCLEKFTDDVDLICSLYSMEQLWLAFVMKQMYGKVWNDKKEIWKEIE